MKLNEDNYARLKAAVLEAAKQYHWLTLEYCQQNNRGKDHAMYWRWSLAYNSKFNLASLYKQDGVNDTHIDTALRRIVTTL